MSVERAGAASSRARSNTIERGLIGVISGRAREAPAMSGFRGSMDVLGQSPGCPEIANTGPPTSSGDLGEGIAGI